jgi:hypothetical protein
MHQQELQSTAPALLEALQRVLSETR